MELNTAAMLQALKVVEETARRAEVLLQFGNFAIG
jgi:hypothetical protein